MKKERCNGNFSGWANRLIKMSQLSIKQISILMEISPSYLYNMINGYAIFSKKHFDNFCEKLKISDQEITVGALLLSTMPIKNQRVRKADIVESTQKICENKQDELETWMRNKLLKANLTINNLSLKMGIRYITLYQHIVGSTQITLDFIFNFCEKVQILDDENHMIELAKNRTIARIKSHKKQKGFDKLYYWFYCELWIRNKSVRSFDNSKILNKSRASIIASVSSLRPIDNEIFNAFCNFLNLSSEEIAEGKRYQELRKLHLESTSEGNEVDIFDVEPDHKDHIIKPNSTISHRLLSLIVTGNYQEEYTVKSLLKLHQTLETLKQSVSLTEETIKQIIKDYFDNPVLETYTES